MAFKELFLNDRNTHILKALLESILKVKINKVEILNNERNSGNVHVARKHVDALLETNIGKIGIEVNNSTEDYVRPRNFSYITDVYSHFTLRGEKYNEDLNVIQINFSYNQKYEELFRVFRVRDDKGNLYVKNFKIYELNMDKYMKFWYDKDTRKIEEYKYLIMLDLSDEDLKILSKSDRVVSNFMSELERVNKDPKFREYMSAEEDNRKIMNSLKEQYTNEGIERGIEQGSLNKSIEIAKSMINKGIDINTISECTGLTTEEIENISL